MPDHLGPQELLQYQCSCGLFSVQKWGGGNFSRPRALHQEMAGTLRHPVSPQEQLPSAPHPIIAAAGWHTCSQPDHNTHLNLGPWCHRVGERRSEEPRAGWTQWGWTVVTGHPELSCCGATASPIR